MSEEEVESLLQGQEDPNGCIHYEGIVLQSNIEDYMKTFSLNFSICVPCN